MACETFTFRPACGAIPSRPTARARRAEREWTLELYVGPFGGGMAQTSNACNPPRSTWTQPHAFHSLILMPESTDLHPTTATIATHDMSIATTASRAVPRILRERSAVFLCDMQEKVSCAPFTSHIR